MDVLGLSQRRACLIVGVARSSFQRAHKHAKDVVTFDKYAELRQWLHTWAAQNPRWGYRRCWIKTKEEGFDVGPDVALGCVASGKSSGSVKETVEAEDLGRSHCQGGASSMCE